MVLDVPMEIRKKQYHCYNCGHVVKAHWDRRRCRTKGCPCTHYWGTDQEAFGHGGGKVPRELKQ